MNRIEEGSFWLPRASSTLAGQMDQAWWIVTVVCIVFGLIVFGAMGYILWKYRRRSENDVVSKVDHNLKIEAVWTLVPLIVVIGLFFVGLRGFVDANVPPSDAMEIRVTAAKWLWTFTYPTGYSEAGELHLPEGRPVKLVMSSRDVLHSFFIPEFRVKQDVVPGQYTTVWFEATREGETMVECTQYCGQSHSNMLAQVHMMKGTEWDKWLDDVSNEGKKYATPADYGKALYTKNSCNTCHSLDGSKIVGPTFKGVFGRSEKLQAGTTVTVDENYIRKSLLEPQADIVEGFPPVMPTFKGVLKDEQIDALIAYLKTIK